jgi:hypothetical protein
MKFSFLFFMKEKCNMNKRGIVIILVGCFIFVLAGCAGISGGKPADMNTTAVKGRWRDVLTRAAEDNVQTATMMLDGGTETLTEPSAFILGETSPAKVVIDGGGRILQYPPAWERERGIKDSQRQ